MAIIAHWQDPIRCVIISATSSDGTFNRTAPIELKVQWISLAARIVICRTLRGHCKFWS